MNDLVLDNFVRSFAESRGISARPEHQVFEAFAASSILRKYHQSDLTDMEEGILVGGGGDGGLDAIAILVNGRPVTTEDDVRFLADNLRRLDVEFVFVQAKTSPTFSASDIGAAGFGVEQFFAALSDSSPRVQFNAEVQQLVELTEYLYRQSIKMQENPKCFFYYVTTGEWAASPDPAGRLEDVKERLDRLNMFSSVRTMPIGADLLKAIYRELERGVVKEVEFSKTAVFPKIDGVDEAYIGLLSGDEFINLVSTSDGELNRELFYDNVRDYQGYNPVNREIGQTLANEQFRNAFPLLNNGVTIIARSIKRRSDTFEISGFQIVNGCQTTHILFQNKAAVSADIFIPVKIVATNDSQVVAEVIKATNRQTAVLPEALESLSPFHRELEDLYVALESDREFSNRIYYERRSKQYAMDHISSVNIVTLTKQIKSFIAMFLDEPHSHPHYYGELLKAYEGRIFAHDHKQEPYYASGVALLMVEQWLNASQSYQQLRPYKHQLLMLLRMLIGGGSIPRLNSNRIAAYSKHIVDTLRDPVRGKTEFTRATELLKNSLGRFSTGEGRAYVAQRNPPHRLRAFTEQLKEDSRSREPVQLSAAAESAIAPGDVVHGQIRFFDDIKRYGFIGIHGVDDIFVHESEIGDVPYHLRVRDTEVQCTVAENQRSPGMLMATNVQLLNPNPPKR